MGKRFDDFEEDDYAPRHTIEEVMNWYLSEDLEDEFFDPSPQDMEERFGVPAKIISVCMKQERWRYKRKREVKAYNKKFGIQRANQLITPANIEELKAVVVGEMLSSVSNRLPKILEELDLMLESGDMSATEMLKYAQQIREERDKSLPLILKTLESVTDNINPAAVTDMGVTADTLMEKLKLIRTLSNDEQMMDQKFEDEYERERREAFSEYN